MWYDTVGHGHPSAVRCACESLGADRLVLGTDFPYETNEAVVRAVKYVSESLKEADARQILEENAATLFGGVVK